VLAALAALGFDWGLHRAIVEVPFAPYSLADRIVRLTPGSVATYLIDHLHHAAKPLLAATCIAAMIAIGGAIRALSPRSTRTAAVSFAAAALVAGLLSPLQRSAWGSALGAAVAGASYFTTLIALRDLAAVRGPLHREPDLARRRALTRLAGILLGGTILNALAPVLGAASGARLLGFASPPRQRRRPPFPRIPGLTPEVTSVADHYIVDIDISTPVVDASSWQLRVGGLVSRPLALGFDELQRRFELVSEYAVLTCISNPVDGPLVGNSLWEGVRLAELLDAAGASKHAWGLQISCADGYTAGIPLDASRDPGSLVAIAQNGQPLTREHGFPCRLRIPALYGMLNPKWVTDIQVIGAPFVGYWAQQGWSRTAIVRTESRIDTPAHARAGQATWIAGIAWAGQRGIERVEVSTDAGQSWRPAQLHEPLSPWAWTQWASPWTPPRPGRYRLMCRATDRLGRIQDVHPRPPHPSGASGYPARTVEVI
jgi:DMSO/TMAO reductase YedYZ molybdopterin-dependent catalytic subunit